MTPLTRGFALAATLVVALLATAGSATATNLTSPAGTTYTGTIKAESEGTVSIHRANETVNCGKSTLEWKVESHGPAITATGFVSSLTFAECGETVTATKGGVFQLHTRSSEAVSYDPLTWNGLQITTVKHFPTGSIDCTYAITQDLQAATITSSKTTGATARLKVETIFPRIGGSVICSNSIQLTAAYRITGPDYLDVD